MRGAHGSESAQGNKAGPKVIPLGRTVFGSVVGPFFKDLRRTSTQTLNATLSGLGCQEHPGMEMGNCIGPTNIRSIYD